MLSRHCLDPYDGKNLSHLQGPRFVGVVARNFPSRLRLLTDIQNNKLVLGEKHDLIWGFHQAALHAKLYDDVVFAYKYESLFLRRILTPCLFTCRLLLPLPLQQVVFEISF